MLAGLHPVLSEDNFDPQSLERARLHLWDGCVIWDVEKGGFDHGAVRGEALDRPET